jgi:hypothetical protein
LTLLVLDEQLAGKRLVDGLRSRGLDISTVGDLGMTGRPDPDVVRTIGGRQSGMWVLVTMDLTIVEEHPGFDWERYAIAWIRVHEHLRGVAIEAAKADVVHRHAHRIAEQARGEHCTYTATQRIRSRPSVASQIRRKL